jgi:hypothetical protein
VIERSIFNVLIEIFPRNFSSVTNFGKRAHRAAENIPEKAADTVICEEKIPQ